MTATYLELAAATSVTVARARTEEALLLQHLERQWRDARQARGSERSRTELRAAWWAARQASATRVAGEEQRRSRRHTDAALAEADGLIERCRRCGGWRISPVHPDGSLRPVDELLGRPIVPHACG